jgi:hypothetical protein
MKRATPYRRALASGRVPRPPTNRERQVAFDLFGTGATKRPSWAERPAANLHESAKQAEKERQQSSNDTT